MIRLLQGLSLIIFAFFFFSISDFGNKNVKPLIKQPWLMIMRVCYPIAPICFLFFLFSAKDVLITDFFGLIFMIIGTVIVIKAKRSLGKRHSWTGYSSVNINEFCKEGIYSRIRHPIYTGIVIAVLGTAGVVIPRIDSSIFLFLVYLFGVISTFVFIMISGKKESAFLIEKFGESYVKYFNQVHPFLPFREYEE